MAYCSLLKNKVATALTETSPYRDWRRDNDLAGGCPDSCNLIIWVLVFNPGGLATAIGAHARNGMTSPHQVESQRTFVVAHCFLLHSINEWLHDPARSNNSRLRLPAVDSIAF